MSAVFNERIRRPDPTETCPNCKQKQVFYLGSDVLNGNPYSPAADTDIEHHYECGNPSCKHAWSVLV